MVNANRTGKVGKNATAWKGGKTSLNRRVKGYQHKTLNWYKKVFERDNFKCTICNSKKKIDVHHIKPISVLIKELLIKYNGPNDNTSKLLWLIQQTEIIDKDLENGITLCRECHRKIHLNWGSHEPRCFINSHEAV